MLPRAAESIVIGTDADCSRLPLPRIPSHNISIAFLFNNINPLQNLRPTKLRIFFAFFTWRTLREKRLGRGTVRFLYSRESFPVGIDRLAAARTRQPEQLPGHPQLSSALFHPS